MAREANKITAGAMKKVLSIPLILGLALYGSAQRFLTNNINSAQATKIASHLAVGMSLSDTERLLTTNGLAHGYGVGGTGYGIRFYLLSDLCSLDLDFPSYSGGLRSASIQSNGVKITSIISPRSELSSTNQEARDAAAKILRETYIPPSRTNWDSLVASLKVGMSKSNILQLLKPVVVRPEGGGGSGTFEAQQFRLDDLWILECHFDHGFLGCKLFPQPLEIWMEPPPHFTGLWTMYRVNGQRSYEIRYKDGKRDGEMTSFYDGGSKAVVTHFIQGVQEGNETGYFPSGNVNYRGAYKANEMVGTSTWFNEDGTV